MNRRLSFGFIVVFVTAFIVAACGRQVTPDPPGLGAGGAPVGFLAIHFDVEAPFNFSNYRYMVVFNTTNSGVTPSTDTFQTNWAGYSFAIVAQGTGIATSAEAVQFVQNQNPHVPPNWLQLGTTPQQLIYNLDSNGTGTEFSVIAQKTIFQGAPSPSPEPTPAKVWTFNAFTTQAGAQGTWLFSDSLGAGGPVDPQFVSPKLCMTEVFDNTYTALFSGVQDPAAQIVSIEISNNPAHPAACP